MNHSTQKTLDLAAQIQQIAAPTFDEKQRAAFVYKRFQEEQFIDVHIDPVGNVYARIPGQGKPPLVVSAHLDTVFPQLTNLQLTRTEEQLSGPGIGDNSLGVAGLFGLVWWLREQNLQPAGDIWLVANVGEEGLGNLIGMRAVVEHFGADVQAYLILEGMALGYIYHRALGVQRYRITARTRGGHSWSDFGEASAIHELSRVALQIIDLPVPDAPRTTFNIGTISGGTSVNTIAAEAWLELDLRSESAEELARLASSVEEIVATANRSNVRFEAQMIGSRPAGELDSSHGLVQLVMDCIQKQGLTPKLTIGSTDANIPLSQGIPAVCVGLTYGSGAHTLEESVQIKPLEKGLAQIGCIVRTIWG